MKLLFALTQLLTLYLFMFVERVREKGKHGSVDALWQNGVLIFIF